MFQSVKSAGAGLPGQEKIANNNIILFPDGLQITATVFSNHSSAWVGEQAVQIRFVMGAGCLYHFGQQFANRE